MIKLINWLIQLDKQHEGFISQFAGSWGAKNSETYENRRKEYIDNLELFYKESGIKSYKGGYYYFNGQIYERMEEDELKNVFFEVMRQLGLHDKNYTDKHAWKDNFLEKIRLYEPLEVNDHCFAFQNGVLDLHEALNGKKHCFHKFSEAYTVTSQLPYKYNSKAKCPKFEKMLSEVLPDEDSRKELQMFLGEALIPHDEISDEHFVYLDGPGSNGKSTISNYIAAVLDKPNCYHTMYHNLTDRGNNGMYLMEKLDGKKACIIDETDPRAFGKNGSDILKALTSHSPMNGRKAFGDPHEIYDLPIVIINANGRPVNAENSHAFNRRMILIEFNISIPPEKRNHNLKAELISEELSGGFNWLFEGTKMVLANNFQFKYEYANILKKNGELIYEDPFDTWIKERHLSSTPTYEGETSRFIQSTTLLKDCNQFMTEHDMPELSSKELKENLEEHDFIWKKTNHFNGYKYYGSFCFFTFTLLEQEPSFMYA